MSAFDLINTVFDNLDLIDSETALFDILSLLTIQIGFDYFALTHHVDFGRHAGAGIRLHNYPAEWARYFDEQGLGVRDPVHRASQLRGAGFAWSTLSDLIALTSEDRDVLDRARRAGIGDGYTVPFHVPGEYSGSCSFALRPGTVLRPEQVPLAQLLGTYAFEAARRVARNAAGAGGRRTRLSRQQRECVVWLGVGKTEWEIGGILGRSPRTINQHLKMAREKAGVSKSAQLVVQALRDGAITFSELLRP